MGDTVKLTDDEVEVLRFVSRWSLLSPLEMTERAHVALDSLANKGVVELRVTVTEAGRAALAQAEKA